MKPAVLIIALLLAAPAQAHDKEKHHGFWYHVWTMGASCEAKVKHDRQHGWNTRCVKRKKK